VRIKRNIGWPLTGRDGKLAAQVSGSGDFELITFFN
jgi:hypothetical protein